MRTFMHACMYFLCGYVYVCGKVYIYTHYVCSTCSYEVICTHISLSLSVVLYSHICMYIDALIEFDKIFAHVYFPYIYTEIWSMLTM